MTSYAQAAATNMAEAKKFREQATAPVTTHAAHSQQERLLNAQLATYHATLANGAALAEIVTLLRTVAGR